MPTNPDFTRAAHIAGAVRLTDIQPTATRWLWPGRIALGRVTLLVSDPGLGKSLLALDLAARVSRAAPWPDEAVKSQETRVESQHSASGSCLSTLDSRLSSTPDSRLPASVLLLSAEDDLADTIRPRLESLDADCSRIVAIPAVPGDTPNKDVPRAFALNRDLARLAGLLDAMPDCRLIIIDPISAYLGGTNEHSNADVQNLLVPLAALARRRNLAVLAVSHLRKKEGAAIYRTMGSLAFIAAARAAWLLAKDPDEPDRRFFLPIKNNLAPDTAGLAFSIVKSQETRVRNQHSDSASGSCLSPLDSGVPILRWESDPVETTGNHPRRRPPPRTTRRRTPVCHRLAPKTPRQWPPLGVRPQARSRRPCHLSTHVVSRLPRSRRRGNQAALRLRQLELETAGQRLPKPRGGIMAIFKSSRGIGQPSQG